MGVASVAILSFFYIFKWFAKENPNNDESFLSLAGLVMVVLHHEVVQAPQRTRKF